VILEFQGKPVRTSDELVQSVINSKPGDTITLRVLRDKQQRTIEVPVASLDLLGEAEPVKASSGDGARGFGLTLGPITPAIAQQLGLPETASGTVVAAVAPHGPAARANVLPGDVILEVNRKRVTSPSDAAAELGRVPDGEVAFLLVMRDGQRTFLPVTRSTER
jgi:serine protease Do